MRRSAALAALAFLGAAACGHGSQGSPSAGPYDATAGQGSGSNASSSFTSGSGDGTPSTSGGGAAPTSGDTTDAAGDDASGDAEPSDATITDAGATNDAPVVACPAGTLAPGDYTQTLDSDAGPRSFDIHVPPGLDASKPAPLVFAFHGGGQNAWQFEGFTHIHEKSDASGFILVEADGTLALGPSALPTPSPDAGVVLEVWNAGNCCEYAAQLNGDIDDVGFVDRMIDKIESLTCIDPKRVFATGFSNGGMLSHRLACQLSNRIASIVAVSGGSGETDYDTNPHEALFDCHPSRPVPVLHIHGTQDACYPFDGGWGPLSLVTFEPVMVTVQNWLTRNGCGQGAPTTVFQNGAATCQKYPCPKAGEVELCTIDGGGHYWPGGDDWGGSTVFCGSGQGVRSADIIANDALWNWFVAHPMP